MNPLDTALQASAPVAMVPKYEEMQWLEQSGHRFLMAADGLWLEVRRSWLHLVWPLAKQEAVAMPYGQVEKRCQVAGGKLPADLIQRFVTDAQLAGHVEHAAWIVWDAEAQRYHYQDVEVLSATEGHVDYLRPKLADGKEMAIDLHSHGADYAYFSPKDNKDDRGEVKVSIVVGQCLTAEPAIKARLCAMGLYLNLPIPTGM